MKLSSPVPTSGIERLRAQLTDLRFERSHASRREDAGEQCSVQVVDGRVLEEDDAGRELDVRLDELEDRAARRGKGAPVHEGALDVVVAAQRVEVVLLVVVERRLIAKPLPVRVRVGVDHHVVRVVPGLHDGRHARIMGRNAHCVKRWEHCTGAPDLALSTLSGTSRPLIDIFVRMSQHHRVPAPAANEVRSTLTRRKPFADSPTIGPRGLRTHQRVLDAALESFAESGYDRTTLDRIAELAGCSRVTIYQYASGKDELFRRLATQAAAQMWAAFEALEDVTPDSSGRASLLICISRLADIEVSLRADHPCVRGSRGDRPVPGGRSGLHHPTSGARLRGSARGQRPSRATARPDRRAAQHRRHQRAQPHVDPACRRARPLPTGSGSTPPSPMSCTERCSARCPG